MHHPVLSLIEDHTQQIQRIGKFLQLKRCDRVKFWVVWFAMIKFQFLIHAIFPLPLIKKSISRFKFVTLQPEIHLFHSYFTKDKLVLLLGGVGIPLH